MKAAVASNNNINVTGHLGRCEGFIIYTIEENKITGREYRQNIFTHHARHQQEEKHEEGHRHNHSHKGLVDGLNDCSIVFFNSGGWRVVEDLRMNNIQPFLTNESVADEVIEKYLAGKLVESPENTCTAHL